MPIIKSAIKRVKQTLAAAHSTLDTAVKKKLLKANTAARRKARLSRLAKEAGVSLAA